MAVSYDLLLLLAWLFIATLPIIALNDGEAIGDSNPFFIAYLWLASFVFYGWFWTHGGQTLGMRAWRIRLVSRRTHNVSWQQAWLRFACALPAWLLLGLGIWWQYLGSDKQSWPDRVSGTGLHFQS